MDYLGLGEHIVSRLRATIPTLHIAHGNELADLVEGTVTPRFPSAYVLFMQDDEIRDAGDGANELVTQRWQVVLVVREVSEPRSSQRLLSAAGPLLSQVIHALRGWTPDPLIWGPLRRQPGGPAQYVPGLLFLSLEFITTFDEETPL